MDAGLFQNALSFYQWVKRVPGQATAFLYIRMAKCFQASGLDFKAEECYQTAIQIDGNNIEARIELARIYEALNQQEQAFIFVNDAMAIQARDETQAATPRKPRRRYRKKGASPVPVSLKPDQPIDQSFSSSKHSRVYKPLRLVDPAERLKEQNLRAQQLQNQYFTLRAEHEKMMAGDGASTQKWMAAAKDLTDDFRGFKTFYPFEKYKRFLGYAGESLVQASSDLTELADRLSRSLPPCPT